MRRRRDVDGEVSTPVRKLNLENFVLAEIPEADAVPGADEAAEDDVAVVVAAAADAAVRPVAVPSGRDSCAGKKAGAGGSTSLASSGKLNSCWAKERRWRFALRCGEGVPNGDVDGVRDERR